LVATCGGGEGGGGAAEGDLRVADGDLTDEQAEISLADGDVAA
jgi:hypothetical protein